MNLKFRLALMNFLEFAVWGAYLTSMGRYLGNLGMGDKIALFYSMQGVVSIFMPALIGIVAASTTNAWTLPSGRRSVYDCNCFLWRKRNGRG